LLVQVTVVPTETVSAAGWKLKLAIDTALPVAAGGALDWGAVGAGEELPEQAAIASMAGKTRAASRA